MKILIGGIKYMHSIIYGTPVSAKFKQGEIVYIRPEFVDMINPMNTDNILSQANNRPWAIQNISSISNSVNDIVYSTHTDYIISNGQIYLTGVKEEYLISISEVRDNKLKQIL